MKVSLIFSPNETKKSNQDGSIPLYLRICYKRKKVENRLNFELSTNDLLKRDSITMRLQERNAPVNHYLNRIESKFQDFLIGNATNLQEYSASAIRDAVLGFKKNERQTIMGFVDKYFEATILSNSNIAPGTVKFTEDPSII